MTKGTNATSDLILKLKDELKPVKPLRSPLKRSLVGFVLFSLATAAAVLITQPFRPHVWHELFTFPRFFCEMSLYFALTLSSLVAAFRLSVPGLKNPKWLLILPWLCLASVTGLLVYGLSHPAMPLTTNGARADCRDEVFVWGAIFTVGLFLLLRRAAPTRQRLAGLFSGLAGGAFMWAAMQMGCMYNPEHALKAHAMPALVIAFVSMLIGRRALRW